VHITAERLSLNGNASHHATQVAKTPEPKKLAEAIQIKNLNLPAQRYVSGPEMQDLHCLLTDPLITGNPGNHSRKCVRNKSHH
jgi:hypothetical protein